MSMDAVLQIKKSIYNLLISDVNLLSKVSGVFDYVPEDTNFPYVVISDARNINWSSLARNGSRVDLEIDVFSRKRGSKEALEIISIIEALIHNANFSITNYNLISARFIEADIKQRGDGLTFHATALFRITVAEV